MSTTMFRPAISLMNRLSYSQKLMLIALVFLTPLVIFTYQLMAQFGADIDFAEKELRGNAYLRPTTALIQHIQQHRGAAAGFLGGDPSFSEVMAQKQAAISEDIAAVDAVEQEYGAEFQSGEEWAAIQTEWRDLQSEVEKLSVEE